MIRSAVIGVGHLGKFHAEKYHLATDSKLIAICDLDLEKAKPLADQFNTTAVTDYRELIGKVNAVSIVTPTPSHYAIGLFFLSHGVHVLMEKPICTSLTEAEHLIQTAQDNNAILQIGHLERFNGTITTLQPHITRPRFIESRRAAPFNLRAIDVNVIYDLMIHDIELIQSMVASPIIDIQATGERVLTSFIDIANARITFDSGCIANVTASRISSKAQRSINIFQSNAHIAADLHHKKIKIASKSSEEIHPGIPAIDYQHLPVPPGDALQDEINAFLHCITHKKMPTVSGLDGKKALETAIRITDLANRNREHFHAKQEALID